MASSIRTTRLPGGVAVLERENPPLTLTTRALTQALDRALAELEDAGDVRAVVVRSGGTSPFGAGSDVGEFHEYFAAGNVLEAKMTYENAVQERLASFPAPTIASITGVAYGGGLELALCCDLLVAAASSRLALPEVALGLFPGGGGPARLVRRVGEGRAKQMTILGEPVDAPLAHRWGLVDKVVPDEQVHSVAVDLATRLAAGPTRAFALVKQAFDLAAGLPTGDAVRASEPLFEQVCRTRDAQEGVAAFLAKQSPRFIGE